ELMSFNGMTMGYILRAKLDPSKITKATIEVKDLDEVEIRYTDDWLAMDGLNEKDIEGLIQELYKPAAKVVWDGGTIIRGGELLKLTLPVKKLIRLGEKARPALQKRLRDPAIQNEVVLILGAIGDESTVPALIEAYPEIDRRRGRPLADNPALKAK